MERTTPNPARRAADRDQLRIALLAYRGNPYSGGQGVYVRHLSRELARLGHLVEVIGGPPYPILDEGVPLRELPGLDLYREPDPFRSPAWHEYRDLLDVLDVATMRVGGYPEPLSFSLRALRYLSARRAWYDVVHDNQCLGYGLLGLARVGLPTLATVHHPIQVDRRIELAAAPTWGRRVSLRRWYAFTRMQRRVASRLPEILTVSSTSARAITAELGVPAQRIQVIPIGTDGDVFAPDARTARVPGRIVVTASADTPLKGLLPLVEAVAKTRAEHPQAHLVVIGQARDGGPVRTAIDALGLAGAVRFVSGISEPELVTLLREAEVACVPSRYEGFSLPAVEAMACGTALVSTTAGALPEVAGPDGVSTLAVPPGNVGALAAALSRVLGDAALRDRLGRAGRARVLERFTWRATAVATADRYRALLAREAGRPC